MVILCIEKSFFWEFGHMNLIYAHNLMEFIKKKKMPFTFFKKINKSASLPFPEFFLLNDSSELNALKH